jgi:hypothetical protein
MPYLLSGNSRLWSHADHSWSQALLRMSFGCPEISVHTNPSFPVVANSGVLSCGSSATRQVIYFLVDNLEHMGKNMTEFCT